MRKPAGSAHVSRIPSVTHLAHLATSFLRFCPRFDVLGYKVYASTCIRASTNTYICNEAQRNLVSVGYFSSPEYPDDARESVVSLERR